MPVSKAVIPVAGFGTRMLPASKAIPKEMLPVVDQPAIQYVVNEAVAAGITEIVLVTHSSKRAIEDHFDHHHELESQLAEKGKHALLAQVQQTLPDGVTVVAVRQDQPKGLGHAVACAATVVGDAPFVVMLPDVLVEEDQPGADLRAMIARFEASQAAQIMVEQVPDERVDQYGIVDLGSTALERGTSLPMTAVVEKPALDQAPSNWSVTGRYVLPGKIFGLLKQTKPGAGNEIQLTDAIASLMTSDTVEAYGMCGDTFDCGSKLGYLDAIMYYALRHPELGEGMRALMHKRLSAGAGE